MGPRTEVEGPAGDSRVVAMAAVSVVQEGGAVEFVVVAVTGCVSFWVAGTFWESGTWMAGVGAGVGSIGRTGVGTGTDAVAEAVAGV